MSDISEIGDSAPDWTINDVPDLDRIPKEEESLFEKYKSLFSYLFVSGHVGYAIHWAHKKRQVEVSPPRPPIPFPLQQTCRTETRPFPEVPVRLPDYHQTVDAGANTTGTSPTISAGPSPYALLFRNAPTREALILFRNLCHRSWFWLASNTSEMNSLGNRIEVLHPFVLLATLYKDVAIRPNDPDNPDRLGPIRTGMRDINSTIRWQFLNGLQRTIDRERNRNNLLNHIDDFARDLGRNDAHAIRTLVQNNDLRGLYQLLFS